MHISLFEMLSGNVMVMWKSFTQNLMDVCSGEEITFNNMSRRSSVILSFEVANHVLAHLTGSTIKEMEMFLLLQISQKRKIMLLAKMYKKLKIVSEQARISKFKHLTGRKVNTSRYV